ncbi:unnamed protein product [Linum trigynum]|uniref:Uncharacterized protein n=1 Tax=Linum trigynum TaxID=586398 RepID=A0AAV2E6N7_9ROSI
MFMKHNGKKKPSPSGYGNQPQYKGQGEGVSNPQHTKSEKLEAIVIGLQTSYKNIKRQFALLINGQPQKPQRNLPRNTKNNPKKEEVKVISTRMGAAKNFQNMKKEEENEEADYPSLFRI